MLKHMEQLDGRLTSIDGNLEVIARAAELVVQSGLLEKLVEHLTESIAEKRRDAAGEVRRLFVATDEDIEAGQWMSRKEAWLHLGVVKSTLEEMLAAGELACYYKKGDEHKKKPRVWLRRADVEEHFGNYTLRKGKEKK